MSSRETRNQEIMHESICIQLCIVYQPLPIHATRHAMEFFFLFSGRFRRIRNAENGNSIIVFRFTHERFVCNWVSTEFRLNENVCCVIQMVARFYGPPKCTHVSLPRITFLQNQNQNHKKQKTKCVHYIVVVISMGFLCEECSIRANSPDFVKFLFE